ncbi:hypothetical protein ACCO45_008058 [Purpureocillium lilacinum]|uniref:Uncharacterized protein n=1 Tax=Purpureocillium lilacinum TaxID=33203 RepID=A0ACC4DM72_PURLI|nr:hypothetical protein PLICBS_009522 [Purpureocillium lilacinum]
MFTKTLILSGLAAVGSAHVYMSNPVPYGKSSLDNFPLKLSGADFPCKDRTGVYNAEGASNVYAQGSQQQLAFVGSAVHGGGSCQVSVTTDLKPTKDSKWKVIHSIIGGCPARNQVGNFGENAALANPNKYDYTIPKELAAGNYTLAWTWFNKVGNREMYMNCAPLTVTGSGGSDGYLNTLPDMYVANIFGDNDCRTPDNADFLFPDPGKNVVFENKATPTATAMMTGACSHNKGGGSPNPYPTPAPQPTSAPRPSNVNNPVQPSQSATKPGGVYITVSSNQPAATSAAPVASQPAASQPAPAPSAVNPGGNTPSGGHAQGAACTTEGAWNCIGGTSFQRCASGTWSAAQPMAAGVQCTAGESSNLETKAKMSKRNMRWARRFAA